jgi:hypothetical protein
MAIVAKMVASEVTGRGGGRYVPCGEHEPGAIAADDKTSPLSNLYTDLPTWLEDAKFLRRDPYAQAAESVALTAVSMPAGSDPDRTNAKWANASPNGQLTLTIHNPEAFGYVKPGAEYRITIERIRGPRESSE